MQKKSLESKKKMFAHIQSLKKHLEKIIFKNTDIMMGSYTEVLARCGKAACHCQQKPAHLIVQFLTYDNNGKRVSKFIRKADRDSIKKKWIRYKACKGALSQFAKFNQKEVKLLQGIIKTRSSKYR